MAFNFTTGPSTLPDIGKLTYNGCLFSPLFESRVSGRAIQDEAGRTVKYMEYTLSVDGYVTLPDGASDTTATMRQLALLLTAQGGSLVYTGRGFDILVNPPGGVNNLVGPSGAGANVQDVAWGPTPKLLEFQPLGAGRSAKVRWEVVVHVPEVAARRGLLLQFNCDTAVAYAEDGYSSMRVRGTLEIPLTRSTVDNRRLVQTADDFRTALDVRIFAGIDLSRFRVARRDYATSRDKRTLTFDVEVEEKPYMDNPPFCTIARGNFSFRPARAGMGLVLWLCTLRCTYTVRADASRRAAWDAFLALLRLRMSQAQFGNVPANGVQGQNPGNPVAAAQGALQQALPLGLGDAAAQVMGFLVPQQQAQNQSVNNSRRAFLIDFSGDEGVHQDSKFSTFSASWRLVTTISHILLASGLWRKVQETDNAGRNIWAATVSDIMGSRSWLPNRLDPALDVVVDFGGGFLPGQQQ